MQTHFTEEQRAEPSFALSEKILRSCVHCGFCTATCPTYVLLGDELDSPRGRIQQIQAMLENDRAPAAETVKHIDRCLSCYSCMTTCPSGVDYMHLADHAREYIAERYRRPVFDVVVRFLIDAFLTRPWLFRPGVTFARLLARVPWLLPRQLRDLVESVPARLPAPSTKSRREVHKAKGPRRLRVALLSGCVQSVIAPQINRAAVDVLTRHGVEVVEVPNEQCCGALSLHLGYTSRSHELAVSLIKEWLWELERGALDAIVTTTSGCGTVIKDYGFVLRNDPHFAAAAERISSLTVDITELLSRLRMKPTMPTSIVKVAYHSACSLMHGQRLGKLPVQLLRDLGFDVSTPQESHICCGSAGTYSLLQPHLSRELRDRKAKNLRATGAGIVAAGNIGCINHLSAAKAQPVVHTVELVDWATGGKKPEELSL